MLLKLCELPFTPDIRGNIGLTWPLMPETWQPHFKETAFASTHFKKHQQTLVIHVYGSSTFGAA